MSFLKKVVLITGASSGIGAETAIYLAQLGASLSITGRNKHNLDKVAEQCGQPKPFIIMGDLANENDVKNIIDLTIKHYGKLDVLVNNAAIFELGSIETASLEQYDNIFNVNIRSIFQLTALAVPHLIKTKGNIVNVSSITGLRPFKNNLLYSMSKATLDHFTRCVALELGSRQVRVNSINPGLVITHIFRNYGSQEQIKKFFEQSKEWHALGRNGDVLEIAKTIAFLASDDASFITGVTLSVDGAQRSMSKLWPILRRAVRSKTYISSLSLTGIPKSNSYFRKSRFKIPRYQNTYRLEACKPFKSEIVDMILIDVMQDYLVGLKYQSQVCMQICQRMSEEVRDKICKEFYDR